MHAAASTSTKPSLAPGPGRTRTPTYLFVLLASAFACSAFALTDLAWVSLQSEVIVTQGITFEKLSVTPRQLCLRLRVDSTDVASSPLHGERCYTLRSPGKVPLLDKRQPATIEFKPTDVCTLASRSRADLDDLLQRMGVPAVLTTKAVAVVGVACSRTHYGLVVGVLVCEAIALTCLVIGETQRHRRRRMWLHVSTLVVACLGAWCGFFETLVWSAYNATGRAVFLNVAAWLLLMGVVGTIGAGASNAFEQGTVTMDTPIGHEKTE